MNPARPARRIALTRPAVLALLLALMAGCDSVGSMLKGIDKPTASIRGVKLDHLDLQGATLAFDVEVKNPYDVPLPLANADYSLASKGATFLTGQADVQGVVPARGAQRVTLPARISFSQLLSTLQGVRPGAVVPYEAALNLGVDAPVAGRLSLPLRKAGELPVPAPPVVELASVNWKSLSLDKAEAELELGVTNPNDFPVTLGRMGYALSLGGVKIAETGVNEGARFGKNDRKTLRIPIAIRPSDLGMAAFRMLTGEGASYSIAGDMALDTPFGALTAPFARSGRTTFQH